MYYVLDESLHMHVYTYVRTHAGMYVCMYACMYVYCLFVCLLICVCTHLMHMHRQMNTCICKYASMHTRLDEYVNVDVLYTSVHRIDVWIDCIDFSIGSTCKTQASCSKTSPTYPNRISSTHIQRYIELVLSSSFRGFLQVIGMLLGYVEAFLDMWMGVAKPFLSSW